MNLRELKAKHPELLDTPAEMSIQAGWYTLIDELCMELRDKNYYSVVELAQCKEKFGGLRFYVDFKDLGISQDDWSRVQSIIGKYEDKSFCVCEECGKPGLPRGGGWIRTLCNKHCEDRSPIRWVPPEPHKCRGWNVCLECKEVSCSVDSLACYDCETWRHRDCAKKHADATGHSGNINDLVYLTKI